MSNIEEIRAKLKDQVPCSWTVIDNIIDTISEVVIASSMDSELRNEWINHAIQLEIEND